jgi:hypothetical protein
MANTDIYIPFTKQYIMYKIMNYGKSYSNYTTYKLIENTDNIEIIYVDNKSCSDKDTIDNIDNIDNIDANITNLSNLSYLSYHVEIHYTKISKKNKFETIMKNYEIDMLLAKYGNKV